MEIECLRISIFYNQTEWHNLLKICLAPLIRELFPDNWPEYYLVFLNKERGDNIRVSFMIRSEKAQSIIDQLDSKISAFLTENPSIDSIPNYMSEDFFMDFPNNSIRCNLFSKKHLLSGSDPNQLTSLRFCISKCILECLSGDPIDPEQSFTFSIYLLFSLIKVYSPKLSEATHFSKELSAMVKDEASKQTTAKNMGGPGAAIDDLLRDNAETFISICHDVWAPQNAENDLGWLIDWCTALSNSLIKEQALLSSYDLLYGILVEHLGLNTGNKRLSAEIIHRTLAEISRHEN
jgi:hypothetical protein